MSTTTQQQSAPDFGEPWSSSDDKWQSIVNRKGGIEASDLSDMHLDLHHRIITCVNACAGMTDPASEIQAMSEAIKEAHDMLKYNMRFSSILTDLETFDGRRTAATLAKLQPFIQP